MRRFPPPWTVEPLDAGYKVLDANGQVLAYVYGHGDERDAQVAKAMLDERESASLVAVMRRDIITTICEYYPWAYCAKTRGAA